MKTRFKVAFGIGIAATVISAVAAVFAVSVKIALESATSGSAGSLSEGTGIIVSAFMLALIMIMCIAAALICAAGGIILSAVTVRQTVKVVKAVSVFMLALNICSAVTSVILLF